MIVLLHRAENCLGLCDQLAQHLGVAPTVLSGSCGAWGPGASLGPNQHSEAAHGARAMPRGYVLSPIPVPKLPLLKCLF